uniref:ShKT domain-containing protein n=1 Tax=Globodera pallida TaxID=36090 RepID=A0A183C476_GLOPA
MTSSMIPSLGQGQLYGNCPPGNYADGSCATLHVCIDPHERCINGICCQPMDNNMPFGYGSGFPLPAWHHGPIGSMIGGGACFDLEESCINFVQHCNVPSVTEVCTHTCGLCHNQPPYVPLPYGGGGGIMTG